MGEVERVKRERESGLCCSKLRIEAGQRERERAVILT